MEINLKMVIYFKKAVIKHNMYFRLFSHIILCVQITLSEVF